MSPGLAASYASCATVARREARNFYPGFLLLPAARRRSMCALYAFLRRSDDLADEPGDEAAKRAALADWRGALGNALAGRDVAHDWPGWPALEDTLARHEIPGRYLFDVLDGVETDVGPVDLQTDAELTEYCYRVASAVGLCCLHVWGFRSDGGRAEALADACGQALQRTNILRDVAEDARGGRVYLPGEARRAHGVTRDDLLSPSVSPALRALLKSEARRAADEYRRGWPLARLIDPVGRPVFGAIVGVYQALLGEIASRDYEVLAGRVSVPGWRKAWVTARALAGRFALASARGMEAPPVR
jgi:phytoene synthase